MKHFEKSADQAFALAKQIRNEKHWLAKLISIYWKLAFFATRVLEKTHFLTPKYLLEVQEKHVLNFGCGNNYYNNAINSDIFAPHRYIMGKKCPDLYWSGTIPHKHLKERFKGVVCEHVIEHMLPDQALDLFQSLYHILEPKGTIVVSFPDIRRVLEGAPTQGYSSATMSMNSLIYRHGHCFMYDKEIVIELLNLAGFANTTIPSSAELPLKNFLDQKREAESSYISATK